jgi:hypothetical protein
LQNDKFLFRHIYHQCKYREKEFLSIFFIRFGLNLADFGPS